MSSHMEKDEEFFPPSCEDTIERYVTVLLRFGSRMSKVKILADKLIFMINQYGDKLFLLLFKTSFNLLSSSSTEQFHAEFIQEILHIIILSSQSRPGFTFYCDMFFNDLPAFPYDALIQLHFETTFPMLLAAINTKYRNEIKDFIDKNCISMLSRYNRFYLPYALYRVFTELGYYSKSVYSRDCPKINNIKAPKYDLQSVFEDFQTKELANPEFFVSYLERFPDTSLSDIIGALAIHSNNFLEYFQSVDYKSQSYFYSNLKSYYDYHFFENLDNEQHKNLTLNGCTFIFKSVSYFTNSNQIDVSQIIKPWKNIEVQFKLLCFIAQDIHYSFKFIDANPPGICWSSILFVQSLVEYTECDYQAVMSLFQSNATLYPDYALLSLIKVRKSCKQYFDKLVNILLPSFFKISEGSAVIDCLWNNYQNTIQNICSRYQPIHAVFLGTPQKYLSLLMQSPNFRFSTDIALMASWYEIFDFTDFLQVNIGCIEQIIAIILQKIDDISEFGISDKALNSFLDFTYRSFNMFANPQRKMILNFYEYVQSKRRINKEYSFLMEIHISSKKQKLEASQIIESFLNEQISMGDFLLSIKQMKSEKQDLADLIINSLLKEYDYIEEHIPEDCKLIINVLPQFLKDGLFSDIQKNKFFSVIIQSLNESVDSQKFGFSCTMIEKMMNMLSSNIIFATALIQNQNIKIKAPKLYQAIINHVETFTFQEFSDFYPPIALHQSVIRYSSYAIPNQKTIKSIQLLEQDLANLPFILEKNSQFVEWIINRLMSMILQTPKCMNYVIQNILQCKKNFFLGFAHCCCHKLYKFINDPKFAKSEGDQLRRKVYILGCVIGEISLAINRPWVLRLFHLQNLIYYSLSRGLLYGVVPFICAIFYRATEMFDPPNPLTSNILCILGSIAIIPSIKTSIKHHIFSLFRHFKVELSDFVLIDDLFPDKTCDNYDFLISPFDLTHIFSDSQLNLIFRYDPNLYFCFITHSIKLPEIIFTVINKMRLVWSLYDNIKAESKKLVQFVTSTVLSIFEIMNISQKAKNHTLNTIKHFIKQISSSIITQPLFFNYDNNISKILKDLFGEIDWIAQFIDDNSLWMHQFLRDIVSYSSFAIIKNEIFKNKEKLEIDTNDESIEYSTSNQFLINHSLNEPIPPKNEIESISLDHDMENICLKLISVINSEIIHGYHSFNELPESSPIYQMINELPLVQITKSSIKTFLYFFQISSNAFHTELLALVFRQLFNSIEKKDYSDFLVSFIKQTPLPSIAYHQLVYLSFIQEYELDEIFQAILNSKDESDPVVISIINFLAKFLIETPVYYPHMFQKSLAIASFLPIDNQTVIYLKQLYSEYPLKTKMEDAGKSFDPYSDIIQHSDYTSMFAQWKSALRSSNEAKIVLITKNCLKFNRNFFAIIFHTESVEIIIKFLKVANHLIDLKQIESSVVYAIYYLVTGFSTYKSYNFSHYYCLIGELLHMYDCIPLLHYLRPLKCASFTFAWTNLITSPHFVASTLQQTDGWKNYLQLLSDLIAALVYLTDTNEPYVFQLMYKSVLRFILILIHDFPDFISASALNLVSILPTKYIQLRNVILSATPKGINMISPLTPDLKIDHLPDVHQVCQTIAPAKYLLSLKVQGILTRCILGGSFETTDFHDLCDSLIENPTQCTNLVTACFEITVGQQITTQQRPPFVRLPVFVLFCNLLTHLPCDIAAFIVECFVDQMRYPNRNTHFFSKLVIEMFKLKIKISNGLDLSELIAMILMKRASVSTPYPWGLQITIIELISNKEIGFWDMPFVTNSVDVQIFVKAVCAMLYDQVV